MNIAKKKAPAVETPIAENEYVKELLALLKENQSPAGKELLEAIGHVSEMEKQLASAVDELKAMRQDLEKMKNSPLKSALQKSIVVLQDRILALRDLDCYEFYPEVQNEEELGRYLIDECGALDVPEHIKDYFDYEAYGRDMFLNTTSDFAGGGYIENNGNPFMEHYDGEVPEEYQIFSYPDEPRHSILEALKQFREAPPPEHGKTAKAATHEER